MKWNNLKSNKCPKCGKDWMGSFGQNLSLNGTMMTHICGFTISEKRYGEVVRNLVSKEIDEERHYRPDDENPE